MKNNEFDNWLAKSFKKALIISCTVTQTAAIILIVANRIHEKKNNINQPTDVTKIFETGEHIIYKSNVTRKDNKGSGEIEWVDGYEPFSINVKGGTVVVGYVNTVPVLCTGTITDNKGRAIFSDFGVAIESETNKTQERGTAKVKKIG